MYLKLRQEETLRVKHSYRIDNKDLYNDFEILALLPSLLIAAEAKRMVRLQRSHL